MKLQRLTFQQNPARTAAELVVARSLDPLKTLVIGPTQRFKTYLASFLRGLTGNENVLAPYLETSADIIGKLIAGTGERLANDMEKLSLLYAACERTGEIGEVFPPEFMRSFSSFGKVASKLLRSFEELGREERDLDAYSEQGFADSRLMRRAVDLLRTLGRNYRMQQEGEGCHDMNFLFQRLTENRIRDYFAPYETIILVSPLSLTRFERRLYSAIEEKLVVMYQDTDGYDFSKVLTFGQEAGEGGRRMPDSERRGNTRFFQAGSNMEQVTVTLELILDALERGRAPEEIAVVNSDETFGRMLYEALDSAHVEVNYSEGLPVRTSPLFQFLLLVSRFFGAGLDTRYFIELLGNELYLELLGEDTAEGAREEYRRIRSSIIRNRVFRLASLKSSYIGGEKRRREVLGLLKRIYASKGFGELNAGLEVLFSKLGGRKTYEYHAVHDIILDTAAYMRDLSIGVGDRPYDMLLQVLQAKRYPLPGVYSRGVQILGLLETRGIDFAMVIVPMFNEGYYPLRRSNDILLPLALRDALELPSFLDREELGFYYLKRFVDGAAEAAFVSISDPGGDTDVTSRYASLFGLAERGFERPPARARSRSGSASAQSKNGGRPVDQPTWRRPVLTFSRLDVDRLKACETKYFIARMLGLDEPRELTRDVDAALVGMGVHRLLTDLYRDMNTDGTDLDLRLLEERLKALLDTQFREGLFYSREEDVMKRLVREHLLRSLRYDVRRFEEGYRICPEYMESPLTAELAGGRYELSGRIDRVDRSPAGGYLLIDYKTGSIPSRKKHLEAADFREVQLGFYGVLLRHTEPRAPIEALCYFDLSDTHRLKRIVEGDEVYPYLDGFEQHLVAFLDRFNSSEQLSLTQDSDNCRRCCFHTVCRIYEP